MASPAPRTEPLLEIRALTKRFPGQVALDAVDLDVQPGEVLALAGANGSGKSTLIKILAGFHEADAGTLRAFGEPAELSGGAWRERCHFIHQDLGLIPTLDAVENLAIGSRYRTRRFGRIDWRAQRVVAEQAIKRFGGEFDLTVPVGRLTPGEQTIVAMARALDGWDDAAAVLVVDEPTASLHREDVATLFGAIRRATEQGAGVVFVSHRIDEMFELAQRVAVLRDGRLAAVEDVDGLTEDRLVSLITGRSLEAHVGGAHARDDEPVLTVRDLEGERVRGVSFDLHRGEILGVSGLMGSGREELPRLLGGEVVPLAGTATLRGEPLPVGSVRRTIDRGLVMVPSDRARRAAVMSHSLHANVMLADPWWAFRRGRVRRRHERFEVATWLGRLEVKPGDQDARIDALSGGNQQKVVLAKWLRRQPDVLVLDEPTQGVDVGAKSAIYGILAATVAEGAGVIVCSSDAKELATICDRVLVIDDGVLCAELRGEGISEQRIIRAAVRPNAGASPGAPSRESTTTNQEASHV